VIDDKGLENEVKATFWYGIVMCGHWEQIALQNFISLGPIVLDRLSKSYRYERRDIMTETRDDRKEKGPASPGYQASRGGNDFGPLRLRGWPRDLFEVSHFRLRASSS
jgi:hypothetical protein